MNKPKKYERGIFKGWEITCDFHADANAYVAVGTKVDGNNVTASLRSTSETQERAVKNLQRTIIAITPFDKAVEVDKTPHFLQDDIYTTERRVSVDGRRLLHCPICAGRDETPYMHQAVVRVANRPEDKDATVHIIGEFGDHTSAVMDAKRVPGRRSVLEISFWCENCGRRSVLQFLQHKGQTEVTWGLPATFSDVDPE